MLRDLLGLFRGDDRHSSMIKMLLPLLSIGLHEGFLFLRVEVLRIKLSALAGFLCRLELEHVDLLRWPVSTRRTFRRRMLLRYIILHVISEKLALDVVT